MLYSETVRVQQCTSSVLAGKLVADDGSLGESGLHSLQELPSIKQDRARLWYWYSINNLTGVFLNRFLKFLIFIEGFT